MRKKLLFLSISLLLALCSNAQYVDGWDKAMNFGGAGVQINDMQYTSNGDLYLVATVMGKYQFGGVNYDAGAQGSYPVYDIVYGKITSNGTQVLLKRMAAIYLENLSNGFRLAPDGCLYAFRTGTGLSKDFGNGITSPQYGLQLIKFSTNGTMEWLKKLPSFTEAEFGSMVAPVPGIHGFQINNQGQIYAIVQSHYPRGAVYPTRVMKLNSTGDEIWHYEITTLASSTNVNFGYNPKDFVDNEGNVTFLTITSATGVLFKGEALAYEEPYQAAFKNWLVALDANGNKKWSHSAYIFPGYYGVNPQSGDIYLNYTYQKSPAAPPALAPFSALPNLAPPPAFSYLPTVYAWSGIVILNRAGAITGTKTSHYPNTVGYPGQMKIADNGRILLYGKYSADTRVVAGDKFLAINATEFAAMEVDNNFTPLSAFRIMGNDAVALKGSKFSIAGRFKTPLTVGSTSLTPSHIDTDFAARFPAWASLQADMLIGQGNLDDIPATLSATYWLGINNNWNDASNWTNGVPTSETEVIFNNAATLQPSVATASKAGRIIINAGETIALPAGLIVTDRIENNGKLSVVSTGSLSFTGFGASEISGMGELAFSGPGISYLFAPATTNMMSFDHIIYMSATVSKLKFIGANARISGSPTVTSTEEDAITGYTASNYISGKLTRAVTSTGAWFFPVGNYAEYAPVHMETNALTGVSFIGIEAKTNSSGNPDLNLAGSVVNKVLGSGFWTISPDQAPASGSYKVVAEKNSYTNGVIEEDRYLLLKRNSNSSWAFEGVNEASRQTGGTVSGSVVSNGQVTASLNNLTAFSDFVIGIGSIAIPPGIAVTASTWNGSVDNTWNNAGNWSNGIPTSLTNAIIPSGLSNYPEIYVEGTDQARSLTIEEGVIMKLNGKLKLTHGLVNNGEAEIFSNTASATFNIFGGGVSGAGKLDFKPGSKIAMVTSGNFNNLVRIDIGNNNYISLAGNYEGGLTIVSGRVNTTGLTQTNPTAVLAITDPVNHIAGPVSRLINPNGYIDIPTGNSSGGVSNRTYGGTYIANYTGQAITFTALFNSNSTTAVSIAQGSTVVNSFINAGQWTITPSAAATTASINLTLRTNGFTNGRASGLIHILRCWGYL